MASPPWEVHSGIHQITRCSSPIRRAASPLQRLVSPIIRATSPLGSILSPRPTGPNLSLPLHRPISTDPRRRNIMLVTCDGYMSDTEAPPIQKHKSRVPRQGHIPPIVQLSELLSRGSPGREIILLESIQAGKIGWDTIKAFSSEANNEVLKCLMSILDSVSQVSVARLLT